MIQQPIQNQIVRSGIIRLIHAFEPFAMVAIILDVHVNETLTHAQIIGRLHRIVESTELREVFNHLAHGMSPCLTSII